MTEPTIFKASDLDEKPEKSNAWKRAAKIGDNTITKGPYKITDNRKSWYCPTASIWDVARLEQLLERNDINTVYDLGAGDCRVSAHLAASGYDVVAYEVRDKLVKSVKQEFPDLEVRCSDYYDDFKNLSDNSGAIVCFGGTNELPYIPSNGLAVQGYSEIGIEAYFNGELIAMW